MPIFINKPDHTFSIECNVCNNYLEFDLDTELIYIEQYIRQYGWGIITEGYLCPLCVTDTTSGKNSIGKEVGNKET